MSGGLLLLSLAVYLNDIREHFNEKTAKDILPDVVLTTNKQRFVEEEEKNQDNDGDAADAAEDLNARERFRMLTFCRITDKLSTEMERRSQVYKDVSTQFSFLNNLRLSGVFQILQ